MNWREVAVRNAVRHLVADYRVPGVDLIIWYANYFKRSFETIATNFEPKSLDVPFGKGLVSSVLEKKPILIRGDNELKQITNEPYHGEIAKKRNWRNYFIRPVAAEENILGAIGLYSKNDFGPTDNAITKFPLLNLSASLLALDVIRDHDRREGQIQKSLLAMDIGRVAEDRFHDIHEQLYGAIGAVGAIKAEPGLSVYSNIYKHAVAAETQIKRASGFTKKYIEEAKNPDALRRADTDLNEIVKMLSRELETRTKIRKANRGQAIDVRMALHPEPLICSIDFDRLYRCLNNILVNAEYWVIRSEKSIKRIDIVSEKQDGIAAVKIRDTGPGLVDKDKIFEPGYSLRGGTGLGLAIAQKVIDLHGGEIKADTEITQWTAFEILLPLVETRR